MVTGVLSLFLSLVLILFACGIFTNAVEWLGKALHLGNGVTGSVLAAVGTALPETIIPIIAVAFTNTSKGDEIGIGAIAGAPFMLSTLGFFITGLAVVSYSLLNKRRIKMNTDYNVFTRDLTFFIIVYGLSILTTFFRKYTIIKTVFPCFLLVTYLIYVKITFCHSNNNAIGEEDSFVLDRLYLTKLFKVKTNLLWITLQLILALLGIILGSHLFVTKVENVSQYFGIAPLILSILITPIATELPEKFNSVIWVSKSKDTLALGNITGAMVFQSCFPVAFGIAFTPWILTGITIVSAILALSCAIMNLVWVRVKKTVNPFMLLSGGAFYIIFLFYLIFI